MNVDARAPYGAPHWMLLFSEPMRAAFEFAGSLCMDSSQQPRGDGHAVVLFPALATGAASMAPLRRFCEQLGYAVHDWGWGHNLGPRGEHAAWLDKLALHVERLTAAQPARISLIGWSLGGIYAREVAKRMEGRVRQVITIGTPFAGSVETTNAALVYRWLAGGTPELEAAEARELRTPPDLPTTSIFSRSDGIVPWQACMHAEPHAQVEDIEVDGSHCGMPWNAEVLAAIASRLKSRPA